MFSPDRGSLCRRRKRKLIPLSFSFFSFFSSLKYCGLRPQPNKISVFVAVRVQGCPLKEKSPAENLFRSQKPFPIRGRVARMYWTLILCVIERRNAVDQLKRFNDRRQLALSVGERFAFIPIQMRSEIQFPDELKLRAFL